MWATPHFSRSIFFAAGSFACSTASGAATSDFVSACVPSTASACVLSAASAGFCSSVTVSDTEYKPSEGFKKHWFAGGTSGHENTHSEVFMLGLVRQATPYPAALKAGPGSTRAWVCTRACFCAMFNTAGDLASL